MTMPDKEKVKNEKHKDYFSRTVTCQCVSAVIIFLVWYFLVCPSSTAKAQLDELLGKELFSVHTVVSLISDYFNDDGTWQVSSDNIVTYTVEDEELTGTGGADMNLYEAAENTSFAHFRVTTPAVCPIEKGKYTSYFGYRINPITKKHSFHTGLDIAAAEGSKIRAVFPGTVTKTGEDERAGKYIFLAHDDGFVTFYCHCSEITATEGAVIRQGETIARVGSTGWSTGPHLHFEIRKNNIRYNPLNIIPDDI